MKLALVREPPAPITVTSWPRATRPSVNQWIIHSMPPYPLGGMGYQGGATIPMRNGFQEPSSETPPERAHRPGAGRAAGEALWGESAPPVGAAMVNRYRFDVPLSRF